MRLSTTARRGIVSAVLLLGLTTSACGVFARPPMETQPPAEQIATAAPVDVGPIPLATGTPAAQSKPGVSEERMFAFLEDLTSIQAYSGWRSSATEGEAQALDYVAAKLEGLDYLRASGLELERQSFHIFLTTEFWDSRLELTISGETSAAPASAMRGSREDIRSALYFDSDGHLNDTERNPVDVSAGVLVITDQAQMDHLAQGAANGKIAVAPYALFDQVTGSSATQNARAVIDSGAAGILLVTQFSNQPGESHGTYAGEGGVFAGIEQSQPLPILFARLEDLAPLGIASLVDLERVEAARLVWDTDILSPGTSGNLVARIPGVDPSRAIILGAHIDSANSPGAMDDGSGSAALLEVAHALAEAHQQPPVDLVLVWFGSEEAGLYGSGYFAATHQELLDRSIGMLQIDCLTRPLDGVPARLELITWPVDHPSSGDPWSQSIQEAAQAEDVPAEAITAYFLASDNGSFSGYDLPNTDLIYEDDAAMERIGGVWYAGHIHDPYDTVELTRDVAGVFVQMGQIALTTALQTADVGAYRVSPPASSRAVLVASHTEPVHMTPSSLFTFGIELAAQGFDVDLIPYGQAVSAADLQDADLVVALPVIDYPDGLLEPEIYDEAWTPAEIDALHAYVDDGGLLLVTNSANRMKYFNRTYEENEDRLEMNALVDLYNVAFQDDVIDSSVANDISDHPLVEGVGQLTLAESNGAAFILAENQTLASADGWPVLALIDAGPGEVLIAADLGLLGMDGSSLGNTRFWRNLAGYALNR